MTSPPELVPSGLIYTVTAVNDRPPRFLDDFTNDATEVETVAARALNRA